MKILALDCSQLLENKLDGMDLGLSFSVDRENFGAYEEIEVYADHDEFSNFVMFFHMISGQQASEAKHVSFLSDIGCSDENLKLS